MLFTQLKKKETNSTRTTRNIMKIRANMSEDVYEESRDNSDSFVGVLLLFNIDSPIVVHNSMREFFFVVYFKIK